MGNNIRFKYRNTGFMRQVFLWFKWNGRWYYKGIEFSKSYFRVYKLTDEGVLPRFRDLYGATRKHRNSPTEATQERKDS